MSSKSHIRHGEAAAMGGGFICTGENDADIMHNSASINLNVLDRC